MTLAEILAEKVVAFEAENDLFVIQSIKDEFAEKCDMLASKGQRNIRIFKENIPRSWDSANCVCVPCKRIAVILEWLASEGFVVKHLPENGIAVSW